MISARRIKRKIKKTGRETARKNTSRKSSRANENIEESKHIHNFHKNDNLPQLDEQIIDLFEDKTQNQELTQPSLYL